MSALTILLFGVLMASPIGSSGLLLAALISHKLYRPAITYALGFLLANLMQAAVVLALFSQLPIASIQGFQHAAHYIGIAIGGLLILAGGYVLKSSSAHRMLSPQAAFTLGLCWTLIQVENWAAYILMAKYAQPIWLAMLGGAAIWLFVAATVFGLTKTMSPTTIQRFCRWALGGGLIFFGVAATGVAVAAML